MSTDRSPEAAASLTVGFSKLDITPAPGLPLDGYEARRGVANGTLHRLYARVLHLAWGDTSAVIIALDVLGASAAVCGEIATAVEASTGTPADNVVVSCTHTHSGPAGLATDLTAETLLRGGASGAVSADGIAEAVEHMHRYRPRLVADVASAARAAISSAVAARVRYRLARARRVAANRIDAGRSVDEFVRMLEFVTEEDGLHLGLLASFGCHSTVLGHDNLSYSGDLFGVAAERIESHTGRPCLFTVGAAADVSTRFTRADQSVESLLTLGGTLADAVIAELSTLAPPPRRPPKPSVRLAVAHVSLDLPYRAAPPVAEAETALARASESLRTAIEQAAPAAELRQRVTALEGARFSLALALDRHGSVTGVVKGAAGPAGSGQVMGVDHVSVTLTAVTIDGVVLVTAPGEVFGSTFADVHLASDPREWMLLSLSNGYLGYFPTAEAAGRGSYEALYTRFDQATTDELARGMKSLVARLH